MYACLMSDSMRTIKGQSEHVGILVNCMLMCIFNTYAFVSVNCSLIRQHEM
jgi:hypothetical protein